MYASKDDVTLLKYGQERERITVLPEFEGWCHNFRQKTFKSFRRGFCTLSIRLMWKGKRGNSSAYGSNVGGLPSLTEFSNFLK